MKLGGQRIYYQQLHGQQAAAELQLCILMLLILEKVVLKLKIELHAFDEVSP